MTHELRVDATMEMKGGEPQAARCPQDLGALKFKGDVSSGFVMRKSPRVPGHLLGKGVLTLILPRGAERFFRTLPSSRLRQSSQGGECSRNAGTILMTLCAELACHIDV